MGAYSKFLKKKLNFSRATGFFASACAVVLVVLHFLNLIHPWLTIVNIGYLIGMTFTSNVTCQDIKVGSPWQKFNAALAVIFYMLAIALLVCGFVLGELSV